MTAGTAPHAAAHKRGQGVPAAAIGARVPEANQASLPLVVALFGLTFVTGVIDAVSFLGLGHVFTANMTGNVVLLGFALGGTANLSVGRSLVALCAFASGSVVGGRLTNARHRKPSGQLLIAMCAEFVFLYFAAGAAPIAGGETSSARLYLVIVLTAMAMGLRNAVVRKLAVPDLTTTVLTLTVTGLAADSALAGGTSPRRRRRMLAILTMCGGAVVGTILLRTFGMWVSFFVAALVVGAIACISIYATGSMNVGSARATRKPPSEIPCSKSRAGARWFVRSPGFEYVGLVTGGVTRSRLHHVRFRFGWHCLSGQHVRPTDPPTLTRPLACPKARVPVGSW